MNEINDHAMEYDANLEAQILVRNSFYTGLYNFTTILFSMLYSFFVARLLTPNAWDVLILAASLILIITQISRLFPPALERTYNYYIPKFLLLKQEKNLKTFIKAGIIFKLSTLIPLFFISLLLFQPISSILPLELQDNILLLFLLSPLIIFDSLSLTLNSINFGFNKANLNFYLYLLRIIITLVSLLFLYLFEDYVNVELIALIIVVSYLFPFIINCLIVTITYIKLRELGSDDFSFRKVSKTTIKYGSPLLLNYFNDAFWPEFQKIGIGFFNIGGTVAGFSAASSYSNISKAVLNSFSGSLIVSFSRMYTAKNVKNPEVTYNLVLKYSLFLICFVSGLLFVLTDFSLKLIYTEEYLSYSILFKILIITIPFQILINPFDANLSAKDKTKLIAPIKVITIIVQLISFFTLLVYFNVIGAVIGLLLAEIINFFFYLIIHFKIAKLRIQLKKFLFQFIIFFGTIFIITLIELIWLNNFYRTMMSNLNLDILMDFPIFSLILFFFIFFGFNFTFKIITKQDMESLEVLFSQKGFLNVVIRKVSKIIKKLAFFKN